MRRTGLRFLLPYMRPYRRALLLGTLYAVIGAGAGAFAPALLGWAVDALLAGITPQALLRYVAGLVGLIVTVAVFRATNERYAGRAITFAGAAQNLSGAFERLQQGSAAAGRIGAVLRRRPAVADAPDAISLRPAAGGWALALARTKQ